MHGYILSLRSLSLDSCNNICLFTLIRNDWKETLLLNGFLVNSMQISSDRKHEQLSLFSQLKTRTLNTKSKVVTNSIYINCQKMFCTCFATPRDFWRKTGFLHLCFSLTLRRDLFMGVCLSV